MFIQPRDSQDEREFPQFSPALVSTRNKNRIRSVGWQAFNNILLLGLLTAVGLWVLYTQGPLAMLPPWNLNQLIWSAEPLIRSLSTAIPSLFNELFSKGR